MFIELLRKRRSIRRFENRPVEKDKIDILVEAALRSFSGKSINPWEFVVVSDPFLLSQLSEAKPHGAAFLKNTPLAIVVCLDPEKSDTWVEDGSIAATMLHLAATDLGLGSCWVQFRMRSHSEGKSASDYAAEILGLRKGLTILSVIAMGYPAEEKKPHPAAGLAMEKISYNRYGQR